MVPDIFFIRLMWGIIQRIPLACMTYVEMFGNGVTIGMGSIQATTRAILQVYKQVITASFVVVAGEYLTHIADQPIVMSSHRGGEMLIWAFVSSAAPRRRITKDGRKGAETKGTKSILH